MSLAQYLNVDKILNLYSQILRTSLVLLSALRSCSVVSSSLWSHGLRAAKLLCPWDFPGKNTGVGCHFLLQGSFLTRGLNPHPLHWQGDSLPLSHQGSPFFPIVLPFSECSTNGIIQFVLLNLASFIPHGAFLLLSHISRTDVPGKYGT